MNVTRPGNSAPALPKLPVGQRRKLMALLVGTGLGMAALSGASAFLMARLLTASGNQTRLTAVAGLLAAAGGIGGFPWAWPR
jgi:hypothetical protein